MEEYNNENEQIEEKKHKKASRFPTILSGIFGGLISAIIVVVLFTSNILPNTNNATDMQHSAVNKELGATPISTVVSSDDQDPKSIDEISKAVVGIVNIQQQNIWTPNEDVGAGSGIIYKKDKDKAYIVTNNHVVAGAQEVEVNINNDERVPAKVLGTDELSDLAVLVIDGSKIDYVADLGTSKDLLVGETVLAIGNPLGMDFSGSVTKGIISGLDRSVKVDTTGDKQPDWVAQVIQTDAAINPGNSGGALVNTKGEVIGINSMKIARHAVEGIGFAIPIDTALPIMEELETKGEIARPFIGVATVEINEVPQDYRSKIALPEEVKGGMVVANVQKDSPADKAGLQQFDVITKINDQEITSSLDLRSYLYSKTGIGDTIKMEIYRNGKPESIQVTLTNQTI